MKQSKTIYLLFALITLLILIIVVQIYRGSASPFQNNTPKASEIPQFIPTPNLKIVSTSITDESLRVTETVKVRFDKAVNKDSLVLQVTPQTEFITLFGPSSTELTIEPVNTWDFDTNYSITIFKSTQSVDNQSLDKDYGFTFKTRPYIGI